MIMIWRGARAPRPTSHCRLGNKDSPAFLLGPGVVLTLDRGSSIYGKGRNVTRTLDLSPKVVSHYTDTTHR